MKNVLITGGSRGIGKAMVESFSKNGYSVAFTYNKSEKEAFSLTEQTGALAVKANSASEREILSAIELVSSQLGGIDVLINNAGVASFSLFSDISLEDWNNMFAVNVTGAFLYTKAVLPYMISKKNGRIINIVSMWGIVGASCEVHYSATKAALIGMTKALAKELGPSGITVNAIAPGLIDTDMNSSLSERDVAAIVEETPVSRIGTCGDVAKTALFLASSDASFITGDVINVSGGLIT